MPFKRIADNISQLGWTDGLAFITARALSTFSRGRINLVRYHLVAQPVPAGDRQTLRPSAASTVFRAEPDAPCVAAFPRPPDVIRQRFANGDLCLVAQSRGQFAGYIWLARGHYDEDEVRCRYELAQPDCSAWDYDVFVAPDFRIGRSFMRLWDGANRHLSEQGVKWSFSRISAFNPGSLQNHEHLGIRRLFSATFLCIGKLQISMIGTHPYFHLSTGSHARPVLRLLPPAEAG